MAPVSLKASQRIDTLKGKETVVMTVLYQERGLCLVTNRRFTIRMPTGAKRNV